jgi:hypothetical protein
MTLDQTGQPQPLPRSFAATLRICARLRMCLPELRVPDKSCRRASMGACCASPDMGDVLAYTFAVKLRARQVPSRSWCISGFPGSDQLRWMR